MLGSTLLLNYILSPFCFILRQILVKLPSYPKTYDPCISVFQVVGVFTHVLPHLGKFGFLFYLSKTSQLWKSNHVHIHLQVDNL